MIESQCLHCRHFVWEGSERVCTAFTDRIPDDLYFNVYDHQYPYEGDQGLRWEPATEWDKEHCVGELYTEGEDEILIPSRKGQ